MTLRNRLLTSLCVAAVAAGAAPGAAPAFTLDRSLAGAGIDRIPVGDRDIAGASGVAVMPDGRTVLAGYAKQGDSTFGAIIRVMPSGEPDPTFAADTSFPGTVFVNAASTPEQAGRATILSDGVLAPDGSIYASGRLVDRVGEFEESAAAFVTHILPDGKVDTSFGPYGNGIAPIGGQAAPQLIQTADGSLFVLVSLEGTGVAAPLTGVVKVTASGKRDNGYGTEGVAPLQAGENDYFTAAQMTLDAQGRMVLAGSILRSSSVVPGVARLTPAGELDPSFGGDPVPGFAAVQAPAVDDGASSDTIDGLSPVVQTLAALAVAADGKIIVAGRGATNGADIALVGRVMPSGKLDAAFGQKGFARFRGQQQRDVRDKNFDTVLTAVLVDGSRIIVAGTQDSVADAVQIKQPAEPGRLGARTTPDLLVAGLTSAGKLDPSAHVGGPVPGVAVVPAGAQRYTRARRMILVGDKLVIVGRAKAVSSQSDPEPDRNASDFLLFRFGKGSPPATDPDPVPGGPTGCTTEPVKVRTATLTGGCFTKKTVSGVVEYTATEGTIQLNGTRMSLLNGTRLVAVPSKGTIRTTTLSGSKGSARVSLAAPGGAVVQLSKGPINFTVPAGGGTRATLRGKGGAACKPIGKAIGTVATQGIGNLLGFPLPGEAKLSVANGLTYVQVNVSLPKPSFVNATGCATLVTTTSGGLQLDSLYIEVGTAELGPLRLGSIAIDYTGASDTWKGTLKVTLPFPKEVEITGTITFQSGDFGAATVAIEFPTAIPIFPAVGLKGVNGGIQIKPFTRITAGVHLVAGPKLFGAAAIDADLQGTISFPGKPYALAVDITGEVRVVSIPLATASVHYDSGGTFFMKGNASFDAYVVGISIDVEGGVQSPHFYVYGAAEVNLGIGSVKAAGLISEVGAAACGGFTNPIKDAAIGFSVRWRGGLDFFTSCDLSPFKTFFAVPTPGGPTIRTDAFSPRAATERTITVAPGTKALGLKVSGAQTPLISVIGPNGQRIDGPTNSTDGPVRPDQIARSPAGAIISYRPQHASYVALNAPAAGQWKIVSQLGTAPIVKVEQSTVLPQPKIRAKVGGKGRARTLAYTQNARAGQTISFVERGAKLEHRIGDVRAGVKAGTIRFSPGAGPSGRRKILAQVSQDGLPRKSVVVASYVAPGPAIPGRARGVRLKVSGSSAVRATWKPVRGAARYLVRFRLKDGHATTVFVKAGARPTARAAAFSPRKGGTVTVTALSSAALKGTSSRAVLKASRR